MPLCNKCKTQFPNWMVIDGVRKNLASRKYCLTCSPMGQHNTKKLNGEPRQDQRIFKCPCGETDPSKFYGNKRSICGKCHTKYTTNRSRLVKIRAVEYKGGQCECCGYSKSMVSLDFHHREPSTKDPNFKNKRGCNWERLKEELDLCMLVCRNCHGEIHEQLSL